MRESAQVFLQQAKNGTLGLEELEAQWPKKADSDSFLAQVREDIDEAIRHLLARAGKIDFDLWHGFWEYTLLQLDDHLLQLNQPPEILLACRRAARRNLIGRSENEIVRFATEICGAVPRAVQEDL